MKRIAAVCLCVAFSLGISPDAVASDYFNMCSDSSGEFIINDGALFARGIDGQINGQEEIKFSETGRTTIRRIEGMCVSKNCNATYAYEAETFLLFAEFELDDFKRQATFLCEVASDGTLAACQCDEVRVTYQQELRPTFATKGKPREVK